jgi:hypothetical protein
MKSRRKIFMIGIENVKMIQGYKKKLKIHSDLY